MFDGRASGLTSIAFRIPAFIHPSRIHHINRIIPGIGVAVGVGYGVGVTVGVKVGVTIGVPVRGSSTMSPKFSGCE